MLLKFALSLGLFFLMSQTSLASESEEHQFLKKIWEFKGQVDTKEEALDQVTEWIVEWDESAKKEGRLVRIRKAVLDLAVEEYGEEKGQKVADEFLEAALADEELVEEVLMKTNPSLSGMDEEQVEVLAKFLIDVLEVVED